MCVLFTFAFCGKSPDSKVSPAKAALGPGCADKPAHPTLSWELELCGASRDGEGSQGTAEVAVGAERFAGGTGGSLTRTDGKGCPAQRVQTRPSPSRGFPKDKQSGALVGFPPARAKGDPDSIRGVGMEQAGSSLEQRLKMGFFPPPPFFLFLINLVGTSPVSG